MIETPYETIANAVEAWRKEHGYQTMLVSIALHYDGEKPREITEILEFDLSNMTAVWNSDWWEGEQSVELVGFAPLSSMHFCGSPLVLGKDHAFEFKLDDEAAQEQVIRDAKKYGMAVLKPKTDYIGRSTAKEHLLNEYPLLQKERLEQTIASIPAADVREVVLCRDCKWYGGREWDNNETGICARTDLGVSYDSFCSAEKRREEQT